MLTSKHSDNQDRENFCNRIFTFDAIAFEAERATKFQQSQAQPIEINSVHNYTEGVMYHYVYSGSSELGHYYRDPWGYGWVWQSYVSGTKANCVKKQTAINNIKKAWILVMS